MLSRITYTFHTILSLLLTIPMASQFPPFKPFIVKPWSRPGDRSKDEIARKTRHSWPDKADFRSVARWGSPPPFFLFSASLRALPLISNRDPSPSSRVSVRVWTSGKRGWPELNTRLIGPHDCPWPAIVFWRTSKSRFLLEKRKKQRGNMGDETRGVGRSGVPFLTFYPLERFLSPDLRAFHPESMLGKKTLSISIAWLDPMNPWTSRNNYAIVLFRDIDWWHGLNEMILSEGFQ